MKQSIKIILFILCIGLIFISTNVYATVGKTVNSSTRIRKEASTTAEVIDSLSEGIEVEITGEEGEWYKVTYNGSIGYIRKDLLSVEEGTFSENTTEGITNENTSTENENTSNETVENTTVNSTENNESSSDSTNPEENTNSIVQDENSTTQENKENETNSLQIGYTGKILVAVDVKILPSINSSVIGKINENAEITVIEIINKWCYIQTDEISGWVLLGKVKTDEINNSQEKTGETTEENNNQEVIENNTENNKNTSTIKYVSTDTLNVREKPESNANIVEQLSLNDAVTVLEETDSTWSKINFNNITGYVSNQFLSDTKTNISSRSEEIKRGESKANETQLNSEKVVENNEVSKNLEANNSSNSKASTSGVTGNDIVNFAKQYVGYKYVSGGASPSSGFDCSGLTYYVYKNFGITLNRSSYEQISNGIGVSRAELQQGDLVLFNNSSNSKIGHVGIYIGSNTFIHAANSKKGVITTSLSSSYYSSRFAGARRIIY